MNTLTTFTEVAPQLVANGYRPVPIKHGGKKPGFDEWQKFAFAPGCESEYRNHGAGILLGDVVGIDIDVSNPDAARAVENQVREVLGVADSADLPRRVGREPRALLVFRTEKPFKKMRTTDFRLQHDAPGEKPAHVEILADGQQFVAYHVHPDTKRPYQWNGHDLLNTPLAELPLLTEAQARKVIEAATEILEEWGDPVTASDNRAEESRGPAKKIPNGGRNAHLTSLAGSMRHRGMTREAIEAALLVENASRCSPPLPEKDVKTIAGSVSRYDPGQSAADVDQWPEPLDLAVLAQTEPETPRFIVPDWLPCGYATLFAGHGGVGKSAIALHLAACLASGKEFAGLSVERRRVLYLSCEDRRGVLHWRLTHICRHLGIELADLSGWLGILELVGHDAILWEKDSRPGAAYTPAYGYLSHAVESFGAEVIFMDGLSDTFGGNENARGDVKRFVNAIAALIPPETGAALIVGHVAKPAATHSATSEGYSGSTGWHNATRARWYLYPETERGDEDRPSRTGKLLLELQKSNLGPIEQAISFRWDDGAHMFLPEPAQSHFDRAHQEREERRGIMLALHGCAAAEIVVPAAMQGPRTALHVLMARPEFPETLRKGKASTRRFWRQIEEMRQIRYVRESEYRRANGHRGVQLSLTSEGERHIAA